MARVYSAAQYEQDYLPKRLGNWQVANPALPERGGKATAATRYSTLPAPKRRSTAFIAGDNGHLQPGVRRVGNSFRLGPSAVDAAPTRWPKPSLVIRAAPAATMGFKGLPLAATAPVSRGGYPGVVATRLLRRPAGEAAASAAGAAKA